MKLKHLLLFLIIVLFFGTASHTAHAVSTTVSYTIPNTLYVPMGYGYDGTICFTCQGSGMAPNPILAPNANVSVSYAATVSDNSSGMAIASGATVTPGQVLKFQFTPHVYSDIYWFGTGYEVDSPYGDWSANAAPSAGVGYVNGTQVVYQCLAKDLFMHFTTGSGYDDFIPLEVAPPTESLTNTAGLSCNAATTDSGGNVTQICTVTAGSGSIAPNFNFASTYGRFYYRDNSSNTCRGMNAAFITPSTGPVYNVPISAATLSYPLSVVPANQPPVTPTLSCPASGLTGQSLSFTVQGTDPNGDPIRYGMDWTNSNSVSEWVPSSGYVPSGTSQTVSHSWATAGTYAIKALSQDSNSANSGWSSSCSVTITNPPTPTALLTASPSSVGYGSASTLQWSSSNATSCTGTGFSTGGATSGSVSTGALTSNQTYSVSCTGAGGTASNSATVTVLPPPPASITATCNANGTAVSLSWPAAPGATSYNPRVNGNPIQPQCGQAGWQVWTDGTTCYPNPDVWGQTTVNNFPVNPGQTYSAYVFSTNANGTNWNSAPSTSFTCSGQADLTAGNTSLSASPTSGTPVTFTATAQNIGNSPSGSFPVLFQVQTSAGTDVSLVDSPYVGGLAAGGSAPASISYTFASAGTYQVRACANYNTSWTAIVTESNYGNNCGGWTAVTVAPPAPTGALSCTVNNQNPTPGTTIIYTVTPSNGATGPYTWNDTQGGSYGTGSTASRLISSLGSYTMFVSGQNVVSQPVSCPVVTGGCGTPSGSMIANPNRVRVGDTTTLIWSASSVNTSCTVSGPGVNQTYPANGSCGVGSGWMTITTPAITRQSVYTLTCDGAQVGQVIVNVVPNFSEF